MPKPNAEEWEKIDREAALTMLADPKRWPMWPWLPMKRRKPNGQWPDIARVHANDTDPDKRVRLFTGTTVEDESITTYEDHAALVAAGWVVD